MNCIILFCKNYAILLTQHFTKVNLVILCKSIANIPVENCAFKSTLIFCMVNLSCRILGIGFRDSNTLWTFTPSCDHLQRNHSTILELKSKVLVQNSVWGRIKQLSAQKFNSNTVSRADIVVSG